LRGARINTFEFTTDTITKIDYFLINVWKKYIIKIVKPTDWIDFVRS